MDEVPFDSYEALASGHTNCSTCVNGDSFATSYPASRYLDYNETTHCLCKCSGPLLLCELDAALRVSMVGHSHLPVRH